MIIQNLCTPFSSLFFNLLFQFVFVNDLLEVPQSLGRVVEYFGLLNSFAHNFVKDDLEAD